MRKSPNLLSVRKIWDFSPHNALTDLIFFQGRFLCVFRESDQHVYGWNGSIRLIASSDAKEWKPVDLFSEEGVDLRDPKISVMPDGKLMLLVEGTVYKDNEYFTRQPRVSFSSDGVHWSPFRTILAPHEWLWRVTWHEGKAFGASYSYSNPEELHEEWIIKLFVSKEGLQYDFITSWDIDSYPSEATLRFTEEGAMVALVRRGGRSDSRAWIGTSLPPYGHWNWTATNKQIGGPNFLILPDKSMWAAGRFFQNSPSGIFEKTALAHMEVGELQPVLFLPSEGDTSYPGMVYREGKLYISYYSSHENNTAIYLAELEYII